MILKKKTIRVGIKTSKVELVKEGGGLHRESRWGLL